MVPLSEEDQTVFDFVINIVLARGYIPKVFAFKNPYPLNPKKPDLFYFLLIRTKQP